MKTIFTTCLLLVVTAVTLGVPTPGSATPPERRSVLENGLVLLTSEQRTLPMVTLHLLFNAGSRHDPPGREGAANLTSGLLTYGTSRRTALQISEELDFIGARLRTRCTRDMATLSLTLLKKELDTGLSLLSEMLTDSQFPLQEVDRAKKSAIATIKSKRENPRSIANERFMEVLFPKSPYGRPVEGSEESVHTIHRQDVVEFYHKFYRPNGTIMAVVGDVSHEDMIQKLNRFLKRWEKAPLPSNPLVPSSSTTANTIRIQRDLTQANITMGHGGITRGNPDYYAIHVMNYILGGSGLSSRLASTIRIESGLAYSVYSRFNAGKDIGTFQVSMQTKTESAREAIDITTREIERIIKDGVTEQELSDAKAFLTGSFPLRLNTNSRLARFLARTEYLELGQDYITRHSELIRKVSREDIHRAAKTYLHPEKLTIVVVTNLEKTK